MSDQIPPALPPVEKTKKEPPNDAPQPAPAAQSEVFGTPPAAPARPQEKGTPSGDTQTATGTATATETAAKSGLNLDNIKQSIEKKGTPTENGTPAAKKFSESPARPDNENSALNFGKIKEAIEKTGKQTASSGKDNSEKAPTPDKLSPQERAKEGIREYTDPKTLRHFQYDEHGRVESVKGKTGCTTTVSYADDSPAAKPSQISQLNGKGKLLVSFTASSDTNLRIDQKTGDVVSSHREQLGTAPGGDPKLAELQVQHHVGPEGLQSKVRSTLDGQRLDKVLINKDLEVYGKFGYFYSGKEGEKNAPVSAVQIDNTGRPVHKYVFENAQEVEAQKPLLREDTSYKEADGKVVERRERFDLASGKSVLAGKTEITVDLNRGKTTITDQQIESGKVVVDQTISFDKEGKPTSFRYKDAKQNRDLSFSFDQQGRPAAVMGDTEGIGDKKALLNFALLSVEGFARQYDVQKLDDSNRQSNLGPTPPREGERPSGTIVLKDGEAGYRQAQVKEGTIYDARDNAIGTVKDNGDVTLTEGGTTRTFNVIKDGQPGEALHGIGTDERRLDLCAGQANSGAQRQEGFNGVLTRLPGDDAASPGEVEKILVVGGNMYDAEGKFLGHMDQNGKVTFDIHGEPRQDANTDLNSFKKGDWIAVGNENGQERQFDLNADISNGRLFLPQIDAATGQPQFVKDGKELPPTEYEIRLGMVINKETGEQIGKFIPPADLGDRLEGGYIVTGNPPQKIPLSNFTRAVFEVNVPGQYSGRTIKGLALGASMDASGQYRPGEGGLVNLQHALKSAHNRVDDAKVKSQNTSEDLTTVALAQEEEKRQKAVVDAIMSKGVVSDDALFRLHKQTANAESAVLGDGLVRMRAKLEHQQDILERLPDKVSGTAKLPDATAPGGIAHCDIAENVLYKKGTRTVIGAINPTDGTMQLFDGKGNLKATQMNQVAGAVWHLEYKGENGQPASVDWITTDRGRIKSVADMKRQVADEVAYAKAFDKEGQDETSRLKLARTEQLAARFNRALDEAVANGIANPPLDGRSPAPGSVLEFCEGGAHKFVNAEKQEARKPPEVIRLRNMSSENWSKSDGAMRLGEDHYGIERGLIYRMRIEEGKLVRGEKCGNMENGYVAIIDGQKIQLSRQSQLLIKFKEDGEAKEHRIIGLGRARTDVDGTVVSGGLVEADELLRRGADAQTMAKEGNLQYLRDLPLFTAGLSNVLSYDKEGQMEEINAVIEKQMTALNTEIDQLFGKGMSGSPITNNHLDHNVKAVHGFIKDMNLSAQDELTIASEASAAQKQTADVVAMTAIGLLTAGSGSVVAMAGLSGRAAITAQVGLNVFGGGLTSAAFRATRSGGWDQFGDNFSSGMIEAGVMTFGTQGARFVSQLKVLNAARLGTAGRLTAAEQQLLANPETKALLNNTFVKNTVEAMSKNQNLARAVEGLWRPGNAVLQSTAFTLAGGIRERNLDMMMNPRHLAEGTVWMLGGEYLGVATRALGNRGKLTAEEFNKAIKSGTPPSVRQWHGQTPFKKYLDEFAQQLPEDAMNNFANSGLGAMSQAYEMERDRLARMHHVDRSAISDRFLQNHASLGNVFDFMLRSAAEGILTTPVSTLGSHTLRSHHERITRPEIERAIRKDVRDSEVDLTMLMEQARVDPLTMAGNRLGFDTSVQDAIDDAVRNNGKFCVAYIDLNNFKKVNDKINYTTGDEALKLFKTTAEQIMRKQDYLARFGGDEFGMLLRDTNDDTMLRQIQDIAILCKPGSAPEVITQERAQQILSEQKKAQQIRDERIANGEVVPEPPVEIIVTPGIGGINWKPGQTVSDLTRAADAAMSKNKDAFKNGQRDYDFIHPLEDLPPLRDERPADKERSLRLRIDRLLSETANEFQNDKLSFEDVVRYRCTLNDAIRQYRDLIDLHPHTKLDNKALTTTNIEKEIERCKDGAQTMALVLADLDNFKLVNDRFGHERGDEVLREYGKFLKSVKRSGDYVGSFGGDEGVIIARNPKDTTRLLKEIDKFMIAVGKEGPFRRITSRDQLKKDAGGNEIEVMVGISAGSANWREGLTAKQLEDAAAEAMHEVKKRHVLEKRSIKRDDIVNKTDTSSSDGERTSAADETGKGKHRINPHELTPENARKLLFEKLLLVGTEVDENGKKVTIEHDFLKTEVMKKFVDGIEAVTSKWEKLDSDTPADSPILKRRREELEIAVSKLSKELGLGRVDLVQADAFLLKSNARAAHVLGKGEIRIRTSDLLGTGGDTETSISLTAAIFHEMLHLEQDVAMARASAVELLREAMAKEGLTPEQSIEALKRPGGTDKVIILYEKNSGANHGELIWFKNALHSEEGLKWISDRLQPGFNLSRDREYQRATVLQKSFRESKNLQAGIDNLTARVKMLRKLTHDPDRLPDDWITSMSFLKQVKDSPERRIELYGYDPLDPKFDQRDSTFVELMDTDPNFAQKVLGNADWQSDLVKHIDKLKAEGKPYQEMPRHAKVLARLELKAILRCGERDGWRQPSGFDEYGFALVDNLIRVIDYSDTMRYNLYARSHFELEAHYVGSAMSKYLQKMQENPVSDGVADELEARRTQALLDALAAGADESDDEPVNLMLGGTVQQHLELEGETDIDSDGNGNESAGERDNGTRIDFQQQQQIENDRQRRNSSNPNSTGINVFRRDPPMPI